jgi:cytidyltransferase-like protein
MSGSAGGNRIPRTAVEKTVQEYIQKVLSRFSSFKGAKISGSYNTGTKSDFGDIDLIVHLDSEDKKNIKAELAKYVSSLPDDVIVPFKSDKYKGKKFLNTGEIITILYPIADMPGNFVQIDNIVSISDKEAEFKKEFLDYPAEVQGLLLGLAKVACLEEDPQAIFARMGIKNIPALEPDQEYEFNLSSSGLTLRIVTLDNFKETDRTDVWKTSDWSNIKKLFINYKIDGTFEELLSDISSKLKNIRSKNRVRGIFNSMVSIKSGEVGTPKGDNKQKSLDKVNTTLSETNLGRYLASLILEAEDQPTIALFPGAFKPPHKGHVDVVKQLLKVSDQVVVLISSKTRDGITADESVAVWNLYKDKGLFDGSVEIKISPITPVKETYDVVEENPDTEFRVAFGKGEISRYKTIERFPNVKIFDAGEVEGISATGLRMALAQKNEEEIAKHIPNEVSVDEFLMALNTKPEEKPAEQPPAETPPPASPTPATPTPEQPLQESPPIEFEQDDYQDYTLENRSKIEKAAYTFNIPIDDMEYAFNGGREVVLNDDMWSNLQNSKSYKMKTLDDAIQHSLKLGINPKPYIDFIKAGKDMPLPLVLCYGQDKYYLVGGEVVLSLYRALGSIPTVLQGTLNLQTRQVHEPIDLGEGLLLEYSEGLIKKIIQKYQSEQPGLSDEDIRTGIIEFDKIKDKLDSNKRDITKYNWNTLQSTIQSNQSTRIKAGKINKNNVEGDVNLVYNKDNIRVYKADSKKACVKYGNGYSFCISARSKDNQFDYYRYGNDDDIPAGLPYFVFDDNKSFAKNEDGNFIDSTHLLVVFALEDGYWHVTEANNKGESIFEPKKAIIKYPQLKKLKDIFTFAPGKEQSGMLGKVLRKYKEDKKLELINAWYRENSNLNDIGIVFPNHDLDQQSIDDILSGKKQLYSVIRHVGNQKMGIYSIAGDNEEDANKKFEEFKEKNNNPNSKTPLILTLIKNPPLNKSTVKYLEGLLKLNNVNINNVNQYLTSWPVKSETEDDEDYINESLNKKVDTDTIKRFIKFAIKKLDIKQTPGGLTLSYNNDEAKTRRSFGTFDPNTGKIWLYVKNRNMADILRTLAHELVHRKQDEDGRIDYESGETGSEIENEANAQAGILLRDFGKQNEEIYQ